MGRRQSVGHGSTTSFNTKDKPSGKVVSNESVINKAPSTYNGYGFNSIFFHFSPATVTALGMFIVSVVVVRYLENLSWINSIYAITGIMTTVGIVITPTNLASRFFTAVLNIVSLGVAAAVIGEISENRKTYVRTLLEHQHKAPSLQREALHTFIAAIVPLLVSSIGFVYLEDWTLDTAIYFTITNGTGLGMDGAIEPRTPIGRLLFSVYVIMELGVACSFLNILGVWISQFMKSFASPNERYENGSTGSSNNGTNSSTSSGSK